MTISKIAILVGTFIVTAGSSAVVATRDKWWPKEEAGNKSKNEAGHEGTITSTPAPQKAAVDGTNNPVGSEPGQVPSR